MAVTFALAIMSHHSAMQLQVHKNPEQRCKRDIFPHTAHEYSFFSTCFSWHSLALAPSHENEDVEESVKSTICGVIKENPFAQKQLMFNKAAKADTE